MDSTPHPATDADRTVVRHVDGNALAGLLADVFATDITVAVMVCAGCGARGPLGGADVEDDGVAAIVRCRSCTHTMLTVLRCADGLTLRVGALDRIELPREIPSA
ncbi:DUF6510 family protein [Microbacterium sp. zg-YB36]|uniref:DUF6510 family protein n=1 Tax=Microbacterium sp. zg-YB36 TaxID=2969407 RepID=UPI00214CAECA|nr:DUF6510 family protein [Microbacterium sp. zg-YB36]MDL5351432.1 DUF6510 family protein [Microbacterium sp. zg-YB36]